jgi:DNA-binding FrmR family transcriptional regulator
VRNGTAQSRGDAGTLSPVAGRALVKKLNIFRQTVFTEETLTMAHIEHSDPLRRDLLAHRNRIEALIDGLDQGLSCAELLSAVHHSHRALGQIRDKLLIEHLHHHLAEENDRSRRDQAANEIAALFLDNP